MIRAHIKRLIETLRAAPNRVFPITFGILFLSAATSFLVHEHAVAQQFGFPLDSGWLDIVIGRHLLRGEMAGLGSESPAYALILGVIDLLGRGNATIVVIIAKALSFGALVMTGWACYRFVRTLLPDALLGILTVAILVPLSPALVWSGTSGLGIAWGTALIALGMRDFADNRHVAGTAWLGAACWFTPIAAPMVLLAYGIRPRTRTIVRVVIGFVALTGWISWRLVSETSLIVPPGTRDWQMWGANWLALAGIARTGFIHPPLLALFAALGVLRLRRRALPLIAAVVVPALVLPIIESSPGAFGRLFFPILPAMFVLAAAGIDLVATRESRGVLRGTRLAMLLIVAYVAWVGPGLWNTRTISAWQVENTVRAGLDVGEWIRENARAGDVVATTAPGAVGYFSGHPIIDLSRTDDVDALIVTVRPPWVAINVAYALPEVLRADYEAVHATGFRVRTGVYPVGPLVVFRRMYRAGMAFRVPRQYDARLQTHTDTDARDAYSPWSTMVIQAHIDRSS